MRLTKLVFAAAVTALSTSPLQAQYFSAAPTPDGSAPGPFWDVPSADDGRGCNIGYVLTNTHSACTNNQLFASYPASAPFNASFKAVADGSQGWFLHANGNPSSSWGFGFSAGAGSTVTYFGGIGGSSPLSELAIRDRNTLAILHTFKQNDATTYNYNVTGNLFFEIGIALYTGIGNNFSWSATTPNQFSAFGSGAIGANSAGCGASGCWVGAEDNRGGTSDYDYNDGVLRILGGEAFFQVPEPSSFALLAAGIGALGMMARRRRQLQA